jgi:hypothetical protein
VEPDVHPGTRLDSVPDIREVDGALDAFDVVGRVAGCEAPEFGGDGITVAYRPEVNGYVTVDVWPHPWPDDMGDPKGQPTLFGAWTMSSGRTRTRAGEVAGFLRSIADYVVDHGAGVIKDGDTTDGPGDRRWQARRFDDSLGTPPRPVLRWLPLDGVRVPAEIVGQPPRT